MKLRILLSTVGLVSLIAGCPRSTLTGNEGNFQFSYDADDRVTDFNKPIAVGARLDVEVHDVGQQRPVELSAAGSDDETVLTVVSFAGNKLTLEGMASGGALIEVEGTTAEGEALNDSVNMLARVPEVLKLWHTCVEGDIANYLVGDRIWVPFDLEMSNGQPVIGYGYYPVTVSDNSALVIDDANVSQTAIVFDLGDSAGSYTIDSELDATSLEVRLVTEGQIDGITEPVVYTLEDIDVGDKGSGYVLPTVGGIPICQSRVGKTVVSDTPEVCSIVDSEPIQGDTSNEANWFEVTGLAAGECLYTVTYPSGNGGAGVSAQFSVTIEP